MTPSNSDNTEECIQLRGEVASLKSQLATYLEGTRIVSEGERRNNKRLANEDRPLIARALQAVWYFIGFGLIEPRNGVHRSPVLLLLGTIFLFVAWRFGKAKW